MTKFNFGAIHGDRHMRAKLRATSPKGKLRKLFK